MRPRGTLQPLAAARTLPASPTPAAAGPTASPTASRRRLAYSDTARFDNSAWFYSMLVGLDAPVWLGGFRFASSHLEFWTWVAIDSMQGVSSQQWGILVVSEYSDFNLAIPH